MTGPAVRALLRLARRDAWRHRGRSVLIVLTLTFPVAGLVAAVTLLHALTVPTTAKATWLLGRADASIELDPDDHGVTRPVSSVVPAGWKTLTSIAGQTRIAGSGGSLRTTSVTDLDYTAPLARGLVQQRSGRAPRTAAEVVVSAAVARAAHLHVGSTVTLTDVGHRVATVVGIAVTPGDLSEDDVWVAPSTLTAAGPSYGATIVLVSPPPGTDVVSWAGKAGGTVLTRYSVLHPVNVPQSRLQSQISVGLTVLVSGLALLEAVLMAGAAFGVGARRSQRDLALLAATGGDAGQVRGVVLSGAVVLGAIAGVVGIGVGLLAAWALLPTAQDYSGHEYVGLSPRPLELVAAFVVGLVTALVSAWLPARGAARAPVVASLRGQRGMTRTSRARVGLALGTAAGGTLLCAWAGRSGRLGNHQFDAILLFAAIAELGFAGCAPSLVGLVGRLSGRLPLTLRLPLRDISRNRNRTGPAVAAIMATLSGVVAMGVYVASEHARSEADFTPTLPATMVALQDYQQRPLPADLVQDVARSLPTLSITAFGDGSGQQSGYVSPSFGGLNETINNLTVGSPALLTALGIPQVIPAFVAGKAVLVDGRSVASGTVPVQVNGPTTSTTHTLPAVAAHVGTYSGLGALVISPATAKALGINPVMDERLLTLSRPAHQAETDAVQSLLLARSRSVNGDYGLLTYHKLDDGKLLLVPLALLAISTLVTFGVTAISTSLSAAESKGDLATLSAVGAQPAVRRRLAIGQASVLALLGGVLGIAAGLVPMAAVIAVRSDVLDFTIPWQVIALALVGVPVVAGGGAGLFTRSRLPLPHRLT
jgi:putative ABC transport system permease protein